MKSVPSLVVISLFAGLLGSACKESRRSSNTSTAQATAAARSASPQGATVTTRVVFLDKEHGCDCTKKRVEAGWSALQTVATGRQAPTIERLHVDTQPEESKQYHQLRPMMAVPALYFLDAKGGLIELLQGEVSSAQIAKVMGPH